MTPDDVSMRDYLDQRFDDLEDKVALQIAAAMVGVVRWKDLASILTAVSVLVGLLYVAKTGHGP